MPEPVLLALSLGRVSERLLIISAATLALFFGWHLFKSGVVIDQTATGEYRGAKIVFSKVGPGTFFAAFGAMVLVVGLIRPLNLENGALSSPNDKLAFNYANDDSKELIDMMGAINVVASEANTADSSRLKKAATVLTKFKGLLAQTKFSAQDLKTYRENRDLFQTAPANLEPDLRVKMKGMADVLEADFGEGN